METQTDKNWENYNEFLNWEREQEENERGRDAEDAFLNDSGWSWETGRFKGD